MQQDALKHRAPSCFLAGGHEGRARPPEGGKAAVIGGPHKDSEIRHKAANYRLPTFNVESTIIALNARITNGR